MQTGHWERIAGRFQHAVPPHRPTEEDIAAYSAAVARCAEKQGGPLRGLILGVTPQLWALPWPDGSDILAVDHTQEMIDNLWPGPPGSALCLDWRTMELPRASRDIAMTDGGANLLAFPDELSLVASKVREILVEGGRFVVRIYALPVQREPAGAVLGDLAAGKITNLAYLKTRLWMALQESPEEGLAVDDVWKAVSEFAPDLSALEAKIGWPAGHLCALDTYRGSPNRYHFFSVDDARAIFGSAGFELESVSTPSYELGDMHPTLVFRRA